MALTQTAMEYKQKFFENFLGKNSAPIGAGKVKRTVQLNVLERRYNNAITAARRKGQPFALSYEEYSSVAAHECVYCDGYFGSVIFGIGLDRIDNNKGYEKGNVVSCCYNCNRVRGHIFSPEETKAMIRLSIRMRQNEAIKIANG